MYLCMYLYIYLYTTKPLVRMDAIETSLGFRKERQAVRWSAFFKNMFR